MAMTPRERSASDSEASLLSAPRSLNELVTWRFSYLTKTSAPVSAESLGAASIGVCSTCPPMVRRAASMSAIVTLMDRLRPAQRSRSNACKSTVPLARKQSILLPPVDSTVRIARKPGHDRQRTEEDPRVDRDL